MAERSLKLSKIPPQYSKGKGDKKPVENKGTKVYEIDHEGYVKGLEVVTPKRIYALPWGHFLKAEGDNAEIVAEFSTDTVTITGSQLVPLLQEFAKQRVSAVRQLGRAERMELSKEGPQIDTITVVKAKRKEE